MKLNKICRFKSFTIAELLIAMIIGGLVVVISLTVLNIITKQYNKGKKDAEEISNLLKLEFLLQNDLDKSENIFTKKDTIFFTMNENDLSKYFFSSEKIIRFTPTIVDTFYIGTLNFEMSNDTAIFKEINLLVDVNGSKVKLNYIKDFSAEYIFEK